MNHQRFYRYYTQTRTSPIKLCSVSRRYQNGEQKKSMFLRPNQESETNESQPTHGGRPSAVKCGNETTSARPHSSSCPCCSTIPPLRSPASIWTSPVKRLATSMTSMTSSFIDDDSTEPTTLRLSFDFRSIEVFCPPSTDKMFCKCSANVLQMFYMWGLGRLPSPVHENTNHSLRMVCSLAGNRTRIKRLGNAYSIR